MISVQMMHDITAQLIDAGHGSRPFVDIENRTRDTDYIIDDVWLNEDLGIVTIEFDEVNREEAE